MLKRVLIFCFLAGLIGVFSQGAYAAANNTLVLSNGYFSFSMPEETKGTYLVEKKNNGIYISEKISAKEGSGGFAFAVTMYKNPKDYADNNDARKIGELTDKSGKLYDVVLICPTEIYYGEGETIQKNFIRLAASVEKLEVKGVNGSKYVKGQGMNGEDLYGETLKQYKTNMKSKRSIKRSGYAYYDLNNDGIDELFIGERGTVYSVYTMVDRKPAEVVSADENEILFLCSEEGLWYEVTDNSGKNTVSIVNLERNSVKLTPVVTFVYDKKQNKNNPYFVKYGTYGALENVSKKDFNERQEIFRSPQKLKYAPFSEVK